MVFLHFFLIFTWFSMGRNQAEIGSSHQPGGDVGLAFVTIWYKNVFFLFICNQTTTQNKNNMKESWNPCWMFFSFKSAFFIGGWHQGLRDSGLKKGHGKSWLVERPRTAWIAWAVALIWRVFFVIFSFPFFNRVSWGTFCLALICIEIGRGVMCAAWLLIVSLPVFSFSFCLALS